MSDMDKISKDMKETLLIVKELKEYFESDLINLIESMYSDDQVAGSLRQYAFDRINGLRVESIRELAEKIKKNMEENDDIEQFQDWFEEVFEDE